MVLMCRNAGSYVDPISKIIAENTLVGATPWMSALTVFL